MNIVARNWRMLVSAAFTVGVFLFWFLGYYMWLAYHEEMQMFRWSWDYFVNDISISGGFADWLGEFVVQFYYVLWLGSLLLALLSLAAQRVTYLLIKDFTTSDSPWLFAASFAVPVILILLMGDISVMLSFPIAVTLALLAAWLMNKPTKICRHSIWMDIVVLPVVFWLLGGGASWLYVAIRLAFAIKHSRIWLYAVMLLYLFGVQSLAKNTIMSQWPEKSVYLGVRYYYIPFQYVGGIWGFDSQLRELLTLDYLVRHERWKDIIERADKYQNYDAFSCNCINLALSQERQLADRMFEFYQTGENALLMERVRDNMSNYPTMEAFWRLGLINSCLRYSSDLQESIMSTQKSGRLTKRIAECHIVNKNYKLAQKHLNLLKQTLFYRRWALETEELMKHSVRVNGHPVYGKLRRYRMKDDKLIFWYPEKDKILGQLFISNTDNKMALDYFIGELMLKCDLQNFMRYLGWAQKYGGYPVMPRGYLDAAQCIKARGNVGNSPYKEYVNRVKGEK